MAQVQDHEATPTAPAQELRFALVVGDYESAVKLYRDVFGLEVLEIFDNQGGRGMLLRVPEATLELFDPDHGHLVDEIEVGRWLGERFRIAVKIDDLEQAAAGVAATGAREMALPVQTPWGDRNQRFKTGDGMQLTLFQPSGPPVS
jgi:catechol 2,3-dioxygenase-like lactoylglutathione lyase family enzyme